MSVFKNQFEVQTIMMYYTHFWILIISHTFKLLNFIMHFGITQNDFPIHSIQSTFQQKCMFTSVWMPGVILSPLNHTNIR